MKTINVNEEKNPSAQAIESLVSHQQGLKPTERPWRWLPDEGQFIVGANDYVIGEIPCQGCNPADGEYIVRVVNAYDELVAALKSMVAAHCPNDKVFCGSCSPARDVLSLVESEQ